MAEETNPAQGGIGRSLYRALGILALVLWILSTGWLVLMAGQWAIPWSSLAITAPPPDETAPR